MGNVHKKPLWRIWEKLAVLQSGFWELKEKVEEFLWHQERATQAEIYTFNSVVSLETPYPNMMPPGFEEEALQRAKKEATRQLAERLMEYATVSEADTIFGRSAVVQIKLGIVSPQATRFRDHEEERIHGF